MRQFVEFCSSLFVLLGMGAVLITAVGCAMVVSSGGGVIALAGAAGVAIAGVLGGASVSMVGGAAYMLCSIDKRLEKAMGGAPPATDAGERSPEFGGMTRAEWREQLRI